jgi:hypothetical protein
MLSALTGCIKSADNSSQVMIADHEASTIENCFSSLVAGPRSSSGKLETVSFAHGICQGSSKALDKLTEQKTVVVIKDNQAHTVPVYIQGKDVIVSLEGLETKIGSVSKNPDDAELILNTGTRLELAIETSAGKVEVWKPGTASKGKEFIRLYLN